MEMKPAGRDPEALYVLEVSEYIVLDPAVLMGKISSFRLNPILPLCIWGALMGFCIVHAMERREIHAPMDSL